MQFWGTYQGFTQHTPLTRQLKQTFYYPRGLRRSPLPISPAERDRLIDYDRSVAHPQPSQSR
ncbi:hypothetical protein [Egbenema bharatensis]|uniref:hypothetical protein n=1 Tax=Egbenema bharatensis TaxID=3463334 RepID=UPI003A8C3D4F